MPVINVLSPHLADLIAAGEVVERPASVIKELVENSFDAGAKNVSVEIRNGGMTYIRVTDDGCGMSPEDAGVAFLRHATSKLHDEADLTSIGTMGFRGEALAAISSVTHMEIITRARGSEEGTRVILDAGEITEMTPYGCPEGTTMICRDLFFNTPARLKFLKSDRSESTACVGAALRCALGRPEISVRFIKDGDEEFFSPGDGKTESALYSLLGREEASGMLVCSSTSPDGHSLEGYISSPAHCRGNRAHQYFFVNGRCIRSASIQAALEQAYKNSLLPGRYPSCVLFLTMDPSSLDVNVHPAKTEVRFGSEKAVFDLVYHSVRLALESEDTLLSSSAKSSSVRYTSSPSSGKNSFYKTMSIDEFRSAAEKLSNDSPNKIPVQTAPTVSTPKVSKPEFRSFEPADRAVGSFAAATGSLPPSAQKTASVTAFPKESAPFAEQTTMDLTSRAESSPKEALSAAVSSGTSAPLPDKTAETPSAFKILGEVFRTYIILERNNDLILIDKHAAHERMIFDRLKSEKRELSSQYLLTPVTVKLTSEDAELIEKNEELLSGLGFEIDAYGDSDFIVRGVPAEMDISDVTGAIEEICEKLKGGNSPDPDSVRDGILHTVACKAAIKAGWDTSPAELGKIAVKVLSGDVKYCPHGRPVSSVITRQELEKMFKRII